MPIRFSAKCPPGFRITPDATVVRCSLGAGRVAIKVNEPVGEQQGYVVFTEEGVSLGELLTLDEIAERVKLLEN